MPQLNVTDIIPKYLDIMRQYPFFSVYDDTKYIKLCVPRFSSILFNFFSNSQEYFF